MKVADFMTRKLVTASPDMPVSESARLILEKHISALPVIDGGELIGLLTDEDLLRRTEAETDLRLSRWQSLLLGSERISEHFVVTRGRTVGELMRRELVLIAPDASLGEALALMEARAVKRLLVLEEGRLIGILSRADLLRALEQVLSQGDSGASVAVSADVAVRRSILSQLEHQQGPAAILDIHVKDGIVELRGWIREEAERQTLRMLVEGTPGVKALVDRLVWIEPKGDSGWNLDRDGSCSQNA